MVREMRRKRQQLSHDESLSILNRMTSGVLALMGGDGFPYALPMSYVYHENQIYFHSALSGHKIDAIENCGKASFCVIEQDDVVPEEFTAYFRSVIAFGNIRILTDEAEKRKVIELLAARYSPEHEQERIEEIEKGFARLHMIELDILHLTGKESIELVKARKG